MGHGETHRLLHELFNNRKYDEVEAPLAPASAAEAGDTPAAVVRRFFALVDALDLDTLKGLIATDAQGVDEIARRWLRSYDEITAYLEGLLPALSDVHSEVSEINETVSG